MKRLLISLAFALCASSLAAQTTLRAGESSPVTLPLWNVLTMTGTGATCVQTRLSDTPGSGQSQGSNAISGSAVVTVGPYATVTRHTISCSVGSLVFDNAPADFVVTGGLLASDIDASDTPADEECLTYDSTGPALEWQTCGGGGLADGDYGDVTVSGTGAAIAIDADSVALGTDTTGGYASSATEAGEANTLAPAVVIEGATADAYEGNVVFTDPTADWTWTWSGTGGVSGVPSITGGASGSSTLTLDGDSTVTGNVTVSGAGQVSPGGGVYIRTDQAISNNAALQVGAAGTLYFMACNGPCTGTGSDGSVVVAASDLQIYTIGQGISFEGTDDTFETRLVATDATADRTITAPDASGTIVLAESASYTIPSAIVAKSTVVTAAGDYNVGSLDYVVVMNKTVAAATTVNLPGSPSTGRTIIVKDGKGDAAANNVTVIPATGTIDGAATIVISTNYGSVAFIYNGSQWNVF